MNSFEEKIASRMKKGEDVPKKQLALLLKTETINQLDMISKAMTKLSGRTSSRNSLIEEALEAYIETSLNMLKKEGIENIEEFISEENYFDTVIFPAHKDGFEEAFLKKKKWYYVRVDASKIDKLKYVCLYVSKPTRAITHYAKIKKFEYIEEEKKYMIHLKGDPIELSNPIPLGDADPNATRAPRYTKFEKILSSNTFKDLF